MFILLKAQLDLREPGGVTAPEQPTGVDLPLARTPGGVLHVPATSIAGSLRAHLAGHPRFLELMGSEPDREQDPGSSALRFAGTHLTATGTSHRQRTSIDRHRAAAGAKPLFRREQLHPGSRIDVFLQLDDPTLRDELVEALRTWTPCVGGGRTTGRGRAELVALRERTLDLRRSADRRAWLTTRGPELYDDRHTTAVDLPDRTEPEPFLALRWRIVDGLHVGAGADIVDGDSGEEQIQVVVRDHQERPCVPGTTWKGVLRSRCEYILRSLGVKPACAPLPAKPCGACLICWAFGWSPPDGEGGRRGALSFADSAIDDAEVVPRKHVALDRVTGGGHDGRLYTHEIVQSGRLALTVHELHTDPARTGAVRALLVLACHDVHHGYLGIGGSTTRGLGTLRLDGEQDALSEQRRRAVRELSHWRTAKGA